MTFCIKILIFCNFYCFRYIHSKNRQGLSFTLAVNHLADKSNEELRLMRGSRKSSVKYNGGLPFNRTEFDFTAPPYFDWRLFGLFKY